jgi:dephospho-CoA kinase
MLRVGLTGNLGSGKSTAADLFQSLGAQVIKADSIGRDLMHSDQAVYQQIIARFGTTILNPDGELNRPALARLVFEGESAAQRLDALNAIIHPAAIAVQLQWLAEVEQRDPKAVAIVESALIFETKYAANTRTFDRIILLTAPDELKISRFINRARLEAETGNRLARQILAQQIPDAEKAPRSDFLLDNSSTFAHLEHQVRNLYTKLAAEASAH